MNSHTYSELEIQDYASGKHTGNLSGFDDFLKENPAAFAQVKEYEQLYHLLSTESIPALSFNLADSVIEKVHRKAYSAEPASFQLLPYVLILITGGALFLTDRYFGFSRSFFLGVDFGLLVASAVVMMLFLAGFYLVEVKHQQKKFLL